MLLVFLPGGGVSYMGGSEAQAAEAAQALYADEFGRLLLRMWILDAGVLLSWTAPLGATYAPSAHGEALSPRVLAALAFLSGYVHVLQRGVLEPPAGPGGGDVRVSLRHHALHHAAGDERGGGAERALSAGRSPAGLVRLSQLGMAASLVLTLPLWDKVPGLFLRLDFLSGSFAGREVVRFVACALLVLPPAVMAGLTFPVVLAEVERGREAVGAAVGRLTAINTLGTVAGSLLAGFVLLDRLGGRGALLGSALVSVALTALLPGTVRLGRWGGVGAAAGAWALGAWLVPAWDPAALLSGSNIYFGKAHDAVDEVVWQREDFSGGVTSVIRTGKQLTLLTNGKFQGNNGSEVKDQRRFALIPNLFVERPERGLNIGLGTATTLGVMGRFPYKSLDAVELSPDIVEAARLFPGEDFFARDARTLAGELLLSEKQVDAWLAAAAKAGPLPLSTDLNLFLEFSTPRGNALGWNYDENLAALLPHSEEDWGFLGELPGKDPLLLPLARLGRARFHETGTEAWHRAVEDALAAVPDPGQRLQVKRGLLSEFKPAPPRTALEVP